MTSGSEAWDEAVIVALGSNLGGDFGEPLALLEAALLAFPTYGLRVAARSSWWRSAAWPDPAQPTYLNGVVLVDTVLTLTNVFEALMSIERSFGRQRTVTNAARTLDLDLLAYGRVVHETERLIVPHPRAHRRLFVMGPRAEIAPTWRHPTLGRTAAELAASAPDGRDAAPDQLSRT